MFNLFQVKKSFFARSFELILLFVFFAINLNGQVSVKVELDTNYMLIGDKMRMKVEMDASTELTFFKAVPQQSDTTGKIEFLSETDWEDNGSNLYQYFTFTCFDSAFYNLLPIKVIYKTEYKTDTAYSNSIGFLVDNPQPDTTMADIKPIFEEPTKLEDFYPLFIFLGILLFAGLLIWFFFFKKKKEVVEEETVVIRPPHEVALEKLDVLKTAGLWQKGKIKDYYSQLTYIFREYLENRFNIQALESTSEEILEQLHKKDFEGRMESDLRRVLQSADLVKFAKAKPAEEFHKESFVKLKNFILETQKEDEPSKQENPDTKI